MERNLRTRRLLLCGLSVFFLFSWISFVFSTLIGDIKLFQASARQASYISSELIFGSFNAWELKSVLSRALSYFLYKIAVLFFPFGTYAYECVCKGVYSVLLLLDVFLSVKLVFGKDREKVLWSFLAVSCLFMASAIDCHMQVEMTGSLLILLAFSLYWNAVRHEKYRVLKLLASGMLIGAVFYFKSILLLLSVSVVAAVCIFLLENRMKLSLRRMMTVVAGSLLSLAILTLLVYLVNPSEFREIMNAAEYQGTFWKPRVMLRKSLLAFLAGHAEKPAFTPALWIGFVCLVMNLIRCIREKEKLQVFFHLVLWMMPALFLLLSNYYFTYHFVTYLFPVAVEVGDLLLHPGRARNIVFGTVSVLAAAWFTIFFSVLSSNDQAYIRMQQEAYGKTAAYLESIDFDRNETVLYLDDGMGAYYLGNPSRLRFFFPLPLQRLHDQSSNPSHVEALDQAMSYSGKYISLDYDWFFCGWRYPQLEKKVMDEYTRVGSYSVFYPPYAIFPTDDIRMKSFDLYVRKE